MDGLSRRLALYYAVADDAGDRFLTSKEISAETGTNSSQVRRDLGVTRFPAGKRGTGYPSVALRDFLLLELRGKGDELAKAASLEYSNAVRLHFAAAATARMAQDEALRPLPETAGV